MSRQNKPQNHTKLFSPFWFNEQKHICCFTKEISWYKVGQTKMFYRNIYSEND